MSGPLYEKRAELRTEHLPQLSCQSQSLAVQTFKPFPCQSCGISLHLCGQYVDTHRRLAIAFALIFAAAMGTLKGIIFGVLIYLPASRGETKDAACRQEIPPGGWLRGDSRSPFRSEGRLSTPQACSNFKPHPRTPEKLIATVYIVRRYIVVEPPLTVFVPGTHDLEPFRAGKATLRNELT
jgi:hypothetical protein